MNKPGITSLETWLSAARGRSARLSLDGRRWVCGLSAYHFGCTATGETTDAAIDAALEKFAEETS